MIDKVAGALPSTGAASATTGASFKSALQGTGAAQGAAFKAPTSAATAKPAVAPTKVAAAKPNGVEPGTRMEVVKPHAKLQPPSPSAAKVIGDVQQAQKKLDTLLKMAESGRTFSPAELLAFQAHAYRASQELDLASKVVEKGTSAVKQTLQTQL